MTESAKSNKIFSLTQLSMLSRDELVSQLLEAQEIIQKLEAVQSQADQLINESVSSYPSSDVKSQAESMFGHSTENSLDSLFESSLYSTDQKEVIKELQFKLKEFETGDCHKLHHYDNEEFTVAYEYKGDFPSCDEDLSMSPFTEDEDGLMTHPEIIINQDTWDNEDSDQLEVFPLIPSPVLNTPPYEYIFLTKTNEAKYRIFLNQKLNKVFHEEIQKLQKREEELLKGKSRYHLDNNLLYQDFSDDKSHEGHNENHEQRKERNMDLHNQNHLISCLSASGIHTSNSNVIHCFDPSDVDLELKKIFTEKPPITHKIVRRKSRRERGSSVPAVDSYYGTRDLHKVGHASYFIPTLTESERKAIGWKNDYHYGHWKYAALNVPNPKTNQISLHPHVEDTHNPHHHSNTLPQNPLHHHEIDLLEPFGEGETEGEATEIQENSSTKHNHSDYHHHHHHDGGAENGNENEDTLSFITLSGCSTDLPPSCHIIPDKGTLRRILKWILPCIKQNATSTRSSLVVTNTNTDDNEAKVDAGDHLPGKKKIRNKEKSKNKKHHEIETLVEPSEKMNFPTSQTYISFATSTSMADEHIFINEWGMGEEGDNQQHQPENNNVEQKDLQGHSHHDHHHGLFHWKNILSHHAHGTPHITNSMSVVGGDVIESIHDCGMVKGRSDKNENGLELERGASSSFQSCIGCKDNDARRPYFEVSSTESEEDDKSSAHSSNDKKLRRKLRPCKAYTKLLTLKDLGYETDEVDDNPAAKHNEIVKNNMKTKTTASKVASSSETDLSTTPSEDLHRHTSESPDIRKSKAKSCKKHNDEEETKSRPRVPSVPTENSTDNAEGNDYDCLSSGGSGYPFSSLSISHQNSEIGSHFVVQTEGITPSASLTEQQTNGIETRFLDPKDLLIPQLDRAIKSDDQLDEDSLPFVFDFYNSNHGTDAIFADCGEQQEDQVIEWMGGEFVDDIGESLGLLSSCLDTFLQYDKLFNNNNDNLSNDEHVTTSEYDDAPEKVDGQHRITTLNDLNKQSDTVSKNDSTASEQ